MSPLEHSQQDSVEFSLKNQLHNGQTDDKWEQQQQQQLFPNALIPSAHQWHNSDSQWITHSLSNSAIRGVEIALTNPDFLQAQQKQLFLLSQQQEKYQFQQQQAQLERLHKQELQQQQHLAQFQQGQAWTEGSMQNFEDQGNLQREQQFNGSGQNNRYSQQQVQQQQVFNPSFQMRTHLSDNHMQQSQQAQQIQENGGIPISQDKHIYIADRNSQLQLVLGSDSENQLSSPPEELNSMRTEDETLQTSEQSQTRQLTETESHQEQSYRNFEISSAQRRFEEIAALEKEIFSLKAVLAARETNLRVADHKAQHAEAREAQLKSQLQMLSLLMEDLKTRNQCLENDFTRVSNQLLARKNKECSQTNEERIQFDEEVKDLQGQIELRMERESELEERMRELEMKLDEREKIIAGFEKEKEEKGEKGLREIAEEMRSKLASKTEEHIVVVEELNNLKQQADAFRESSSKTVEYLNQVLGQKQLEIESLHVQVDSAPQQLPHLLQKLQEASLRESALQEQLTLLKQQKKSVEESQTQSASKQVEDNSEQKIEEIVQQRVEGIISERLLALESQRNADKKQEQGRIYSLLDEKRREIENEVRLCVEQENRIIQTNIEQEVETLRNERLALKEQQQQLDDDKNKLEDDRASAEKDRSKLLEEKQEFDSSKQLFQEVIQKLNESKRKVEEDQIQLKQERKSLWEESQQIKGDQEELQEEIRKIKQLNEELERDQSRIQMDKQNIEKEIVKIEEQRLSVQCQFEELETQMSVIEQLKLEISAEKQELTDERSKLIEEQNRLNVVQSQLLEEQMELRAQETLREEERKQAQIERDSIREEQQADFQNKLKDKDQEISRLNAIETELKDLLTSENQQLSEERQELKTKLNQAELTIKENLLKIKEITEQLLLAERKREEYEQMLIQEQTSKEEYQQKKQLVDKEIEHTMLLEFEMKYKKLSDEVNSVQMKLFECEKQLTHARQEVDKKDNMLLENMSQIDMLNEQLILNEIQRKDTKNSQKELESSQTLNKVLESQIQVLNDALSLCQARLNDIQSQFHIHTNKTALEISNSNKIIEELQKQLSQKEKEIEGKAESGKEQAQQWHQREGQYIEQITLLTEGAAVLEENKEKLAAELLELEGKFLGLSEELILKVQELNAKSQEYNEVLEELKKKEGEMKETSERMVDKDRDYDEKMAEIKLTAQRECGEVIRKNEELLIREEELQKLIELKNGVIIEIEQHNAMLASQIQDKIEQIQSLSAEQPPPEKDSQTSQISELLDKVENTEQQLNLKEEECNKLQKQNEEQALSLQAEINSWKETVQMLEEKTNALVQELEEAEDKIALGNERIKSQEDDMAVLIEEIRNHKENMIGQEILQEKEQMIEFLKLEIAQIERQFLEQKEQLKVEFEDELRLLKKEVSILREQLVQQSNLNKEGIKKILESQIKDKESFETEKIAILEEIQAVKEEKLIFQQRSSELFEKNRELLDRIDTLSQRNTDLVYSNESLKDKMILISKQQHQEQEYKNGQIDAAKISLAAGKEQQNTQETQTESNVEESGLFEQLRQDLLLNQVHLQELDRFNRSLLDAKKQLEEQVEVLIKQNDELSNLNTQLEYQCVEFINQHKNNQEKMQTEREPLQETDSNLIQSEMYPQQTANSEKQYCQSLHLSQGFNQNSDDLKGQEENQLHYSDNSSSRLAATQNYSLQSNQAFSSRTNQKQNIPPHPQSKVFSNTLRDSMVSMKGEKISGSQFPYFLLPPKKHERSASSSSSSKNSLIQLKVIAARESPFKV